MAKTLPATELAQRIEELLEERQHHAEAIASIDETLAGVAASLTGTAAAPRKQKRAPSAAAPSATAPAKARRGRKSRKYDLTAEESVLAFVKLHNNPTTHDIKDHYISEGRGGTVDNVLSKFFRENKLRREPLEGQRGSRYLLA